LSLDPIETVNFEQPNVHALQTHVVLLGEYGLIFAIDNFEG
jgi:hypothetical protein